MVRLSTTPREFRHRLSGCRASHASLEAAWSSLHMNEDRRQELIERGPSIHTWQLSDGLSCEGRPGCVGRCVPGVGHLQLSRAACPKVPCPVPRPGTRRVGRRRGLMIQDDEIFPEGGWPAQLWTHSVLRGRHAVGNECMWLLPGEATRTRSDGSASPWLQTIAMHVAQRVGQPTGWLSEMGRLRLRDPPPAASGFLECKRVVGGRDVFWRDQRHSSVEAVHQRCLELARSRHPPLA